MAQRRDKGTGSVFQRADGRFVAQLRDPITNKIQTAYAKTEKQAHAKLREMEKRIEAGLVAVDTNQTLKAFADIWIKDRAGKRRSEATIDEYASRLKCHVYPVLGHKKLKAITIHDVENMLDKAAKTLSPPSVEGVKNAISAMFSDAVKDRLLVHNPARLAELPISKPQAPQEIPTTAEIRALIKDGENAKTDEEFELARIILFIVNTGARIGEVLSAKWSDLDLDKGVWALKSTVTRKRKGRVKVGDRTKTGESRNVALSIEAVDLLKHQRDYVAFKKAKRRVWTEQDLVFPAKFGTVRDPSNLRDLLHEKYPDWEYNFHGIRRWFTSKGLMSGAGLVQISRFVGHKSTRTTTDLYGYLLDEGSEMILREIRNALDE